MHLALHESCTWFVMQATYTDAYVPKKPRSSSQQNLSNLAKSNSQQKLSSPEKGVNSQPSNLPRSPIPAQQQQKDNDTDITTE